MLHKLAGDCEDGSALVIQCLMELLWCCQQDTEPLYYAYLPLVYEPAIVIVVIVAIMIITDKCCHFS